MLRQISTPNMMHINSGVVTLRRNFTASSPDMCYQSMPCLRLNQILMYLSDSKSGLIQLIPSQRMEWIVLILPYLFISTTLNSSTSINLRDNPVYSFMAAPGDSANRFRVRFNSAAGISGLKTINIFIYAVQGNIVLNNEGNYEGTYYVYNTTGVLMATLRMQPGKQYITDLPAGMYIVKAMTGGTIITRKVVLL